MNSYSFGKKTFFFFRFTDDRSLLPSCVNWGRHSQAGHTQSPRWALKKQEQFGGGGELFGGSQLEALIWDTTQMAEPGRPPGEGTKGKAGTGQGPACQLEQGPEEMGDGRRNPPWARGLIHFSLCHSLYGGL